MRGCCCCAQAGLVLTLLFVPNIMSLDLREGDRRFDALMAANPGAYTGAAVAPQNLSFFERCALRAEETSPPPHAALLSITSALSPGFPSSCGPLSVCCVRQGSMHACIRVSGTRLVLVLWLFRCAASF